MTEPLATYFVRLLIALAVGGAIGLEREFKGKPAGMRTNILMCMGSCLIMIISIEVGRAAGGVGDPGRIAAQVVTGVGFLGAGTIIRSRFHVSGLTTAATIWVLSALGLAIGAGYTLLAVIGAFLITVTLVFIRYIEDAINRRRATHIIELTLETREGIVGSILEVFSDLAIPSEALEVKRSGERWTATFEYTVSRQKHLTLIDRLSDLDGVQGVSEV
jgi:putative Mg2+ transporter-C (MgtC) family protein